MVETTIFDSLLDSYSSLRRRTYSIHEQSFGERKPLDERTTRKLNRVIPRKYGYDQLVKLMTTLGSGQEAAEGDTFAASQDETGKIRWNQGPGRNFKGVSVTAEEFIQYIKNRLYDMGHREGEGGEFEEEDPGHQGPPTGFQGVKQEVFEPTQSQVDDFHFTLSQVGVDDEEIDGLFTGLINTLNGNYASAKLKPFVQNNPEVSREIFSVFEDATKILKKAKRLKTPEAFLSGGDEIEVTHTITRSPEVNSLIEKIQKGTTLRRNSSDGSLCIGGGRGGSRHFPLCHALSSEIGVRNYGVATGGATRDIGEALRGIVVIDSDNDKVSTGASLITHSGGTRKEQTDVGGSLEGVYAYFLAEATNGMSNPEELKAHTENLAKAVAVLNAATHYVGAQFPEGLYPAEWIDEAETGKQLQRVVGSDLRDSTVRLIATVRRFANQKAEFLNSLGGKIESVQQVGEEGGKDDVLVTFSDPMDLSITQAALSNAGISMSDSRNSFGVEEGRGEGVMGIDQKNYFMDDHIKKGGMTPASEFGVARTQKDRDKSESLFRQMLGVCKEQGWDDVHIKALMRERKLGARTLQILNNGVGNLRDPRATTAVLNLFKSQLNKLGGDKDEVDSMINTYKQAVSDGDKDTLKRTSNQLFTAWRASRAKKSALIRRASAAHTLFMVPSDLGDSIVNYNSYSTGESYYTSQSQLIDTLVGGLAKGDIVADVGHDGRTRIYPKGGDVDADWLWSINTGMHGTKTRTSATCNNKHLKDSSVRGTDLVTTMSGQV